MTTMAEIGQFQAARTLDALEVDRLEDEELDALPFGVICLDRYATILRYNTYEAQMARLDRADVVGRSFFEEIAPCTATPEFQGRFRDYVEGRIREPVVRFDYLFDFKFGAQHVTIELTHVDQERFYLLVNRVKFDEPRRGAPVVAPVQRELVEPEHDAGALRDQREQRVVRAPLPLFEALLRTCDRVAPKTWEVFCHEWGVQWGRRMVVDLEVDCLEATGQSLRERPMQEVCDRLSGHVEAQGWGTLRVDLSTAASGGVLLELERSALVAASRRHDQRRCFLLAGMLSAAFSHLAARRLHVEEVRCAAAGHPQCEFLVVGATRRTTVSGWVRQGADAHTILGKLEHGEAA